MSTDVLTPPKPVEVAIVPFTPLCVQPRAPTKRRPTLVKKGSMYEANQRLRKQLLDYPKSEIEETDINDLLNDTREKCILEVIKNDSGDQFILFDDGTYEMMSNPKNQEYALCNVIENNE